jgi:hypothetical protein
VRKWNTGPRASSRHLIFHGRKTDDEAKTFPLSRENLPAHGEDFTAIGENPPAI